jgi:N-acetylmuramoyl-L-alanine amidase
MAAMVVLSLVSVDAAYAKWSWPWSHETPKASPKHAVSPRQSSPRHVTAPRRVVEPKPATSPKPPLKCERSTFRVVLDVGHTRQSDGAMSARNVPEFDFNLRLAKRIVEKLKAEGFAETSLLVTEGKARPSLFKRVDAANHLGANLFLSIHHDSVPDRLLEDWEFEGKKSHYSDRFSGYSLFVSRDNPQFEVSLMFAQLLGKQIKAGGLQYAKQYTLPIMGRFRRQLLDKDVGVYRYDELVVLRKTLMPAVLLEAGSIINRDEELVMNSPERQDVITAAVAEALKAFCDAR